MGIFYTKEEYWIGPFGVKIPTTIDEVVSVDRCNRVFQNGGSTQMYLQIFHPYTESEYKEKYATFNVDDGCWYWK